MKVEPLGDRAYILRELETPAYEAAAWLNAHPPHGLIEAAASYDTVGLTVDDGFDPESLALGSGSPKAPRRHEIPIWYEAGEDLAGAAGHLGLSPHDLAQAHASAEYTCFALGFCPGFPYLGPLPDRLRGLPRLDSPRKRVEPGSVAITGNQTAVYPLPGPGGWRIIGRTPLTLVDIGDEYFPIEAGDRVRFRAIDEAEFRALEGRRL